MSAGMKIGLLLSVTAACGLGYLIYDKLVNKPGTAANAQANATGEKDEKAKSADPSKEPERLDGVDKDAAVSKQVADRADEAEEDMFNDVPTAGKTTAGKPADDDRAMNVDDEMPMEPTGRAAGKHPLASADSRTNSGDGLERTASATGTGSAMDDLDAVDMDDNGTQPGRGMSTAASNTGADEESEVATDLFDTSNDEPPVSRKTAETTKPATKPAAKTASGTLRKGSTTIVPANGRSNLSPERLGEWEPDPEDKTAAPKTTLITPAEAGAELDETIVADANTFETETTELDGSALEAADSVALMSPSKRATSTGTTSIEPGGMDVDLDAETTAITDVDTGAGATNRRATLITDDRSSSAEQVPEEELDVAAGYRERSTRDVANRSTIPVDDEMTASYTKPVSRSNLGDDSAAAAEEYVVAPGDNFWAISKKVYGTVRYFRALTKHNETISSEKELRPGMIVSAPAAATLQRKYPDLIEATPKSPAASGDQVRLMSARVESRGTSSSASGSTRIRLPKLEEETATATGTNRSAAGHPAQSEAGYFEAADGTPRVRVGSDDTLSGIALQYLGKASRWTEVFDLNRDVLKDENTLVPGTVLKLPRDAASVAIVTSEDGEPH